MHKLAALLNAAIFFLFWLAVLYATLSGCFMWSNSRICSYINVCV